MALVMNGSRYIVTEPEVPLGPAQTETFEAQWATMRDQVGHLRAQVHALHSSSRILETELQREVDTRHRDDELVLASLSQLRQSFQEQFCGRGARADLTIDAAEVTRAALESIERERAEVMLTMRQTIAMLEERSRAVQERQDDCVRRQSALSANLESLRTSLTSDLSHVDESRRTGDQVLEAELERMMEELDARLHTQMTSFDELFAQLDMKLCANREANLEELRETFEERVACFDRALVTEARAREEGDLRSYEAIDELGRIARDGLAHDGLARDGIAQQSTEFDRLKLELRSTLEAQGSAQQNVELDRFKQELLSTLEVRLSLTGLYGRAATAACEEQQRGSEAQWKSLAEEQRRGLVRVADVEERLEVLDAAVLGEGGLVDEVRKRAAAEMQGLWTRPHESSGPSRHPRSGSRGASSATDAQAEVFLMRDV